MARCSSKTLANKRCKRKTKKGKKSCGRHGKRASSREQFCSYCGGNHTISMCSRRTLKKKKSLRKRKSRKGRRRKKIRRKKIRSRRRNPINILLDNISFHYDSDDEHWEDKTLDRALLVIKSSLKKLAKRLKLEVRGL